MPKCVASAIVLNTLRWNQLDRLVSFLNELWRRDVHNLLHAARSALS